VQIRARRKKLRKTCLATLIFSQDIPMLLAGDEMGNTQFGNNNAYCQDNEISWLKWAQREGRHDRFRRRMHQAAP
jgi:isoamylase